MAATEYPQQRNTPAAYAPYTPPIRRPFSGFAVAGFITSLLSLGILGVILSIAGAWQTRDGTRRGTGLAIFGILIGLAWTPLNVATIGSVFTFLTNGG